MTEDNPREETESIHLNSDPIEVARRHSERGARTGAPEQIGPYKILSELGAGGMGIVYLAEQTKPIHRRVALKVIKLGMDTKQVIARFETEREALALMNHPNVAKVFDAGATETGRPYFAMEYIAGIPITEYCDKHRLNTEERLRLFMNVCSAVQHAHQKGIIHRDIKPSNVLVTEIDNVPTVKVIDFGIAKATQQRLSEVTFSTQEGQFIGTPAYMSPEQAGAATHDIDTRTDVYSLGVLLYELLVGTRPFDDAMLRSAALSEIQRIIREVDPPKPSLRLSGIGALSTTIAENRGTQSRTLARHLRGDLDWIVMKCLEKDRTRRYDTVNALVMEVQRFLHNEPVMAGPPSAVYRLRKFTRRNRAALVAVSLVLAGTTSGMFWALWERSQAIEAKQQAQKEKDFAQAAKVEADQARDEAEQVVEFLTETLGAADPEKEGKEVTVREVMEKAADQVGSKFSAKPLIEARLRHTIGGTYRGLGLLDAAQAHLAEAAAIYTRELGPRDRQTLIAANDLTVVVGDQGHFSKAEAAQRSTLEIQRRVLGEEHPNTLSFMNNLANALRAQGRYAEAETLYRQTLEIRRRVLGEGHRKTLTSMNSLSAIFIEQGRYAEAETLCRQTLEIQRRVLGEEHPESLTSMNNLALSLNDQGRYAEAEEFHRQTLEIRRRVLGAEHPDTLTSMNNLAVSLNDQDRYADAEELCQRTLEIQRRVLGAEHPDVALTMHNLAERLENSQRWVEAEPLCRQAGSIWAASLPADHRNRRANANLLGGILAMSGRFAEAEPLLIESYDALHNDAGLSPADKKAMVDRFIHLYEKWDAAEPGKGYTEKAAEWRARYEELSSK